jgi:hypothetical protein
MEYCLSHFSSAKSLTRDRSSHIFKKERDFSVANFITGSLFTGHGLRE